MGTPCHMLCEQTREYIEEKFGVRKKQEGDWDSRRYGAAPYASEKDIRYCSTCAKWFEIMFRPEPRDKVLRCPCCKNVFRVTSRRPLWKRKRMLKRI